MSSVEELLAQIDHTLEDWDTSGDAMRWTPEEQPQTTEPGEWVQLGYITGCITDDIPGFMAGMHANRVLLDEAWEVLDMFSASLGAFLESLNRPIEITFELTPPALEFSAESVTPLYLRPEDWDGGSKPKTLTFTHARPPRPIDNMLAQTDTDLSNLTRWTRWAG